MIAIDQLDGQLKWYPDQAAGGITSVNGQTGPAVTLTPAHLGATTVGAAMFVLTNPGAVSFPRINANNSVTARSATELVADLDGSLRAAICGGAFGVVDTEDDDVMLSYDGGWNLADAATFRSAFGALSIGTSLITLANPGAITFPRFNADNTTTALNAAGFRTAIGATTVGEALFTAANPSAIRYIRIDASNAVTLRTAAQMLGDLGGEAALGNPAGDGYLLSSTAAGVRSWISPSGGGDASTNTATSVDSEIVLFSGTGGKTLKRATGSGIVKMTSGVIGTGATTSDLTEGSNLYYTDARVRLNRLDQMAVPTADISMGSHKITNVTDPGSAQDAATKNYVDTLYAGLRKMSVRAATTAAGTLATSFENGDSAGGVTLATGDYILIKDQAAQAENGIYVVNASGAPTRATYADSAAEIDGLMVIVEDGTNAGTIWITTSDITTLNTDAIVFTQFNKATDLVDGSGLGLSGLTLSVNVDGSTIEISSDALRVKDAGITLAKMANLAANSIIGNNTGGSAAPIALSVSQVKTMLSLNLVENTALSTWAGSTNITTLGTIATGTWQGSAIGAAYLPGSFAGFANPTGSLGLTAVNGSAATAMRSDGAPALNVTISPVWTGSHTFKITDSATTTITDLMTFGHGTSGTAAAGFGAGILFNLESSTTDDQNAARLAVSWTVATHASRTSALQILLVNSAAALAGVAMFFASGGFSVNSTTDPGAGIINANSGFRVANAATSGNVLRGNGTNFVSATLAVADLSDTKTGTGNIVLATSPTLVTPLLGTPTSGTLTNCSGLPIAGLVASTSTAIGVGSVELGHATDTTITRVSAGVIAVEGVNVLLNGGALGTPGSGTLTNCSGLPAAGLVATTSTAVGFGSIELGHATDTTLSRSAAGVLAVEGVVIPSISSTNTITNKRNTKRSLQSSNDTTFDIDTDLYDYAEDTGLTGGVTVTWSGTPTLGQTLWVAITGTAARAITWDTDFESSTATLPTTTVTTARLDIGFIWNSATSKFRCIAVA